MRLLWLLPAVALLAGCNFSRFYVKGSGVVKTEIRQLGAFSKVETRGSMDLVVFRAPAARVEITTDDNLLPIVQTLVVGGKLTIKTSKGYTSSTGMKVLVYAPEINELVLGGSGNIDVPRAAGGQLSLDILGSGNITAAGEVRTLDATINGSGDMRLDKLKATEARIAINGSGNASVNATASLNAVINGSGDIRYLGNPQSVTTSVRGSGDIQKVAR